MNQNKEQTKELLDKLEQLKNQKDLGSLGDKFSKLHDQLKEVIE